MVKILSHIVVSVMLLLSATGTSINMHFCQGHLYDLAFNAPAQDCCENETDDHTCPHDHDMGKSPHCDDESIKIESSHDFIASGFTDVFEDLHSFELFSTSTHLPDIPEAEFTFVPGIFNFIKPPQQVVLSQIQVFLI